MPRTAMHTTSSTSTPSTHNDSDALALYGQTFQSRLLLGTSRYPSPATLKAAVERARPAMVTAALRRMGTGTADVGRNSFWELLRELNVPVLPNTAGCHRAQEAITTSHMAREVFGTPWIKLEVIGDDYTLQPDTLNLVAAAETLIRDGFYVLPYCTEDLVLCQRLVDVGCQVVMASCALWQPAVLGSTGTFRPRSSSQKPWPLSAGLLPWRRSDAVTIAGCERCTAACNTAGEG